LIFSEKLVLEEKAYRTIKLRGIVSFICRPGKAFKGVDIKKAPKFGAFQCGALAKASFCCCEIKNAYQLR
jgi:hypothetical protein